MEDGTAASDGIGTIGEADTDGIRRATIVIIVSTAEAALSDIATAPGDEF